MKKLLLIFLSFCLVALSSCNKENEKTLNLVDTPKQVEQCADDLINYLKPDRYAWSHTIMQGKLNLTVDFVCKIDVYYAKDKYNYYTEYICYIIDNDVEFEEIYYERV